MFQESCVKGYLWKSLVLTGGSGFVFFLLGRFLCGFSVDISGITAVSAGLICLWLYGGLSLKRLCGQVDQVGDIFDEILAESSMEETRRRTEDVWKKRLPHPLDEGAVGKYRKVIF